MSHELLDIEILDELRELADGDAGFLRDLVEHFRADARDRLARLETAARTGDLQACHQIAHALCGSSANLGAIEVASACRAMEALNGSESAAELADAVRTVREAYERVLPLLEDLAHGLH